MVRRPPPLFNSLLKGAVLFSYMVAIVEIKGQKSSHYVRLPLCAPEKNALMKNLLCRNFKDLYGFTSLYGGHPHRTGQKFANSPFKDLTKKEEFLQIAPPPLRIFPYAPYKHKKYFYYMTLMPLN